MGLGWDGQSASSCFCHPIGFTESGPVLHPLLLTGVRMDRDGLGLSAAQNQHLQQVVKRGMVKQPCEREEIM